VTGGVVFSGIIWEIEKNKKSRPHQGYADESGFQLLVVPAMGNAKILRSLT
jgi:hypothetical protein